ncbi:MAG: hypothetical protein V4726_16275 [Verrucomicrobiota bacterium]
MTPNSPLLVDCGIHGKRTAAVVCRHLLSNNGQSMGFMENSSDPDDLQAWCSGCEAMFLAEGDRTEAFERFNNYAMICTVCYGLIKVRHES